MERLSDKYHWQSKANCGDKDPELFTSDRPSRESIMAAKAICGDCVVQVDCLDFAIENNYDSGIWGGLTEKERDQVSRRRRRFNK